MLHLNSKLSERGHIIYSDGRLYSRCHPSMWIVTEKRDGPITCVFSDDFRVIRDNIDNAKDVYRLLTKDEHGYVNVSDHSFSDVRVSGKMVAHIDCTQTRSDTLSITVENGAVVYAVVRHTKAEIILHSHAMLFLIGSIEEIALSADRTSKINMSRCSRPRHISLTIPTITTDLFLQREETTRQRYVRTAISFPHSEEDCTPVTVDTAIDQQCLTCCERIINAVFDPCGHKCMCLMCAEQHRKTVELDFKCPLCRTEIDAVRLFHS